MVATSAASALTPMIVVGVVLGLALIFIGFCIGLYRYLEKRKARAINQDIEAQQKQSAWRELLLSRVWTRGLTRKQQTGTPRDGEVSVVVLDSSKQPHAAVPATPQPQEGWSRMQTIAE